MAKVGKTAKDNSIYGFDQWKLNVAHPPPTMWMNLGYWTKAGFNNASDFPSACLALLEEVLKTAGIIDEAGVLRRRPEALLDIYDLGFGCGDQTLHLTMPTPQPASDSRPICNGYIGITNNKKQYTYALQRLESREIRSEHVRIFCADAGNPGSWSPELREVVAKQISTASEAGVKETWVLGLDSLYHFAPSRVPIFTYACKSLRASIMAFDLVRAKNISTVDWFILKLICVATSVPLRNFLTVDQYRRQMVDAGYDAESIEIRDISDDVFEPLVAFLREREKQLQTFGLSLGALKGAKWIFGWWARSGVVRGCIVVAKK